MQGLVLRWLDLATLCCILNGFMERVIVQYGGQTISGCFGIGLVSRSGSMLDTRVPSVLHICLDLSERVHSDY